VCAAVGRRRHFLGNLPFLFCSLGRRLIKDFMS
jgi:hypothetical protein